MKCLRTTGIVAMLAFSVLLARADAGDDAVAKLDNAWMAAQSSRSADGANGDQTAYNKAHLRVLKDTAAQAHDFAEKNPNHPKVRHAKKIEALAALSQAEFGDVTAEPKALRLGYMFRHDLQNEEADRFEVAAKMMGYAIAQKQLPASQLMAEYEKRADGLVAEFPQHAGVYEIYLGLMRLSGPADARRMAVKVLVSPASSTVKDKARDIIAQLDLVGTRPEIEFTAADGTSFQLKDQIGKVVIFYVWTSQSPDVSTLFAALNKEASGLTLVGVNIDQDPAAAANTASKFGAPGVQYSDARGLQGPLPQQLKVQQVPSIYIFKSDGTLSGVGSVPDLERLIASSR